MSCRRPTPTLAAALGALAVLIPAAALAAEGVGIDACGDIFVELSAACEVEPPGVTCESKCTPPAVVTSCATELATVCKDVCTETWVEKEVEVCSDNCVTKCSVNPGSFSCSASCGASCGATCSSKCSASANRAQCEASCEATCSLHCGGQCNVVLPSASCQEKCTPSCRGVVIAEKNVDCQVQCQEEKFTTCESTLVGGCKTDCESQEGALFCDGQFIDHDGNLQQCIDALKNFKITVSAEGSITIDTGCGVGGGVTPHLPWLAPLLLLPLVRRRRRRIA